MDLDFQCSSVFEKNYEAYLDPSVKIIANQGGSRSTKTYSICQLLDLDAMQQKEESITTIARKELSTLKATVMRDFFEILREHNLYNESNHNKTDNLYKLGNVLFEFVGLDKPTKKRGAKRRNLFVNEINELTLEDWRQLIMRTTNKIFIDWNPSEEFGFVYDEILTRDDCKFIHSTYLDNPFLEKTVKEEIERFKDIDENYWRVYGLGERGVSVVKIYNNYKVISDAEWNEAMKNINETSYGLDFGYNVATSLIELNEKENDIYCKELIYKTHLLNSDLISEMNFLNVNKNKYINADNAEPDKIKEISNAGYNVYPADKSVNDGIDYVQRKKLFIHCDSLNLIKEIKNYSWKTDKSGKILDEPVKANDHAMDALRYGLYRKTADPRVWFV